LQAEYQQLGLGTGLEVLHTPRQELSKMKMLVFGIMGCNMEHAASIAVIYLVDDCVRFKHLLKAQSSD